MTTREAANTCQLVSTFIPQDHTIRLFAKNGKEIGCLDLSGPELTFKGDADAYAKIFVDFVAGYFSSRLEIEGRRVRAEEAAKCEALEKDAARKLANNIEQRLHEWRQRHINSNGDRLALDDFMDASSLDDLIDFVFDEQAINATIAAQEQK